MMRADLHVHSCHSRHPSEWILQRLGAHESYTEVEKVYRLAKERGADFVTLTDHNTIDGALELVARHPADCFVSTEATAYFPEDGCKIHVLCYGITPLQFAAIQKARANIYNLRDYLRAENIACSVAHATFNIDGRLTLPHLEKLILLFNVFEGLNGARGRVGNATWQEVLRNLTPEHLARLQAAHRIEPWDDRPWVKGLTGGSDDHAGLFIGEAFTVAPGRTPADFLQSLRTRHSQPGGRCGDHKSLAYALYKIASEFAGRKSQGSGVPGLAGLLSRMLFAEQGPALRDRFFVRKTRFRKTRRNKILGQFLQEMLAVGRAGEERGPSWQAEAAYQALARLLDEFVADLARSVEAGATGQDVPDLLAAVTGTLPAAAFASPFFSALRMLHRGRGLNQELTAAFGLQSATHDRRVLWFSDTVADLNGVSVTMHAMAAAARRLGRPLRLVGCRAPEEDVRQMPVDMLELPCIYAVTPRFYNAHTLRLPSMLRAIDLIEAERPDRIVISTPGPVGLTGLVAAWLLGVPCVGVYHTDFTRQAVAVTGDPAVASWVEDYTRWFFSRVDELRVPSQAYMALLADRGFDRSRMQPFTRGLDSDFTDLEPATREAARRRWFADGIPTVLYAGRLGAEKDLGFLVRVWRRLVDEGVTAQLLLAGDGPERAVLERDLAGCGRVVFAGRLDRDQLRGCYALADVFVFPSTTDTFGMAVLEAQAFGLPAVVANAGGPPEIVRDGHTGYTLDPADETRWAELLRSLLQAQQRDPDDYAAWRVEIAAATRSANGWEQLLTSIMGPAAESVSADPVPVPSPPRCASEPVCRRVPV